MTNLRDLLDEAISPAVEGLKEAGIREVHIQSEEAGGAVGLVGEGFTLVLHDGDQGPSPFLGMGAAAPAIEAPRPAEPREPEPKPATQARPKAQAPGPSAAESRAAGDAALRCGEVLARHKWERRGDRHRCERCGVLRPRSSSTPTPRTSRVQAEAFQRGGAAAEARPDGQRGMNQLQPRGETPDRCPRCSKLLENAETPHGPRLMCAPPPRGCGWLEWTLTKGAA